MASRKVGDGQTGAAIAPATLQKKAAQKSSWSGDRRPPNRSTLSLPQHLLCTQRRIALLDHLPVMCAIAHRVMEEIARHDSHSRSFIHRDGFVDQALTPVPAPAIKETKLIVGIPTPAANPTAHVEGA